MSLSLVCRMVSAGLNNPFGLGNVQHRISSLLFAGWSVELHKSWGLGRIMIEIIAMAINRLIMIMLLSGKLPIMFSGTASIGNIPGPNYGTAGAKHRGRVE